MKQAQDDIKLEFKDPQNQAQSIQRMCIDLKKTMEKQLYVKLNKQCLSYFENLIQEQLNFYIIKEDNTKSKQSLKKPTCRDLLKVLNDVVKKQNSSIEVTLTRKEIVTLILMMYLDLIHYEQENDFIQFSQFRRFISHIEEFQHQCIQYYLLQSFCDFQDDDAELVKFKKQSFPPPKNYKCQNIEMCQYKTNTFQKNETLNTDTTLYVDHEDQHKLNQFLQRKYYQYPESLVKLLFMNQNEDEVVLISNLIKFNDQKMDNNNNVCHKKLNAKQINNMIIINPTNSTQKQVDESYVLKYFSKFYSVFRLAAEHPKSQLWIPPYWNTNSVVLDFLIQIWALSFVSLELKSVNNVLFASFTDDYVKQLGIKQGTKLSHQFVLAYVKQINSEKI